MATLARLVLSLAAALALVGHSSGRIPPGVQEIGVRSPSGVVHVTDPTQVDRVVRWFDRLPTAGPGIFNCPNLVYGPKITLTFRDAGGVLARARYAADFPNHSLVSGQCTPIAFSVEGPRAKALIGGRFLLRVQRLLGVRLL